MTLTKKALARSLDSMRISATDEQKNTILERFSAEPFPYEWSAQDIFTQIENFLNCGEFTQDAHLYLGNITDFGGAF